MIAAVVLLTGLVQAADDPPASIELGERQGALVVERRGVEIGRLSLPALPRQIALRGQVGFIALGPLGLWVVDVSDPSRPVAASKIAEGKDVVGVLLGPGTLVHVVEASYSLSSFDVSDPKLPHPQAFSPAAPTASAVAGGGTPVGIQAGPRRVAGTIVEVRSGRVIVDRGSADGLARDRRIQILSQELIDRPNLLTGATERVPSQEPVAVLEIDAVDEHRASAPVHRGDRCRPGDRFVTTTEPPTERLFMPPRQDFVHRLAVVFRPFIELGTLGLGSLSDFRYGYRFPFPLSLEVGVSPLAFEVRRGQGPRQYPTELDATAFYDTDFFAVGLGAGAMAYSARQVERWEGGSMPVLVTEGKAAVHLALVQGARLGSVDGLSVEMRNGFVYRKEDDSEAQAAFHWGSTDVHGHVPLTRRLTLSAGGGRGSNGWAYGELGIKAYFRGTGGAGTMIVPVSVGVGGLTRGVSRVGPLLTIGLELRR
jgi:hypothetical protein